MTWFKIDDGFHSHPKILTVGNAAAGLFVRLGSYCSQHSTDGVVPAMLAKAYGTRGELQRLVACGLVVGHPDGWVIPDFLEYNPSAAETAAKRQVRADAGRRGGLASGRARQANEEPNGEANASARGEAELNPVPSRPDPNTLTSSSVLTAVPDPPVDDDDYEKALDIVVAAKVAGYRMAKPNAYKHATRLNTHLEDGEVMRRMLKDGTPVEQVALFVLGHGASTAKDREGVARCPSSCDCGGSGYVAYRDEHDLSWAEECPNRPR